MVILGWLIFKFYLPSSFQEIERLKEEVDRTKELQEQKDALAQKLQVTRRYKLESLCIQCCTDFPGYSTK